MLKKFINAFLIALIFFISGCGNKLQESFAVTSETKHEIGEVNGKDLVGRQSETGMLVYGPYVKLPQGIYMAIFDVVAKDGPEKKIVAVADVAKSFDDNLEQIGIANIYSKSQSQIIISFEVNNPQAEYEFRIFTNGLSEITYKGVKLIKLSVK